MKRAVSTGVAVLSLVCLVFAAGCGNQNKPEPGVDVAASPPTPGAPTAQKQNAGAQPDMTLYPAPSGVKTGLEGGKK